MKTRLRLGIAVFASSDVLVFSLIFLTEIIIVIFYGRSWFVEENFINKINK